MLTRAAWDTGTRRSDQSWMAAALALGRQGNGRTAPNPSVGAVIVKDGVVVGLGRTADSGRPHAEVVALRQAGDAARGATVYCTLEPCSHFGKSPPCADALIAAGIARAVVAIEDPNPEVAGRGTSRLRAAGIDVDVGLGAAQATRDMAGHLTRMRLGRPYVTLKLAVSADGAIGRLGAGQVAVTGPLTRRFVHVMRAEHDAIAVGSGTVLADDPALTCRLPGMAGLSPQRVVFDTEARTPPTAAIFAGPAKTFGTVAGPTILAAPDVDAGRVAALEAAGATVVAVPRGADRRIDPAAALATLAAAGVTRLMVEGGAALAEALWAADLIDEVVWIEGPHALGGDLVRPFGGEGRSRLAQRFALGHVSPVGDDRWLHWLR
ncbi:bifunctional diaminohydroxyphosphoribosylaminopyrimidine deaminase/5-amino-6-(5-phosphoribosylamino)uracil reductase RibD [Acuticoccus sediminis]|uniref:Riboflavin biosynthesis protein RibD n=1 Tax=Acuticoccus sediminis TaxID=2184697 RepID=A0A8B2NT26_9HYPH|nr:bifunctional diaminohydroxyphosphoribosylaminopyrimidine deaminase/5-amino-6-(5-phosphoribosylamino)uracil reductase RibD [Acuticoccus sediminis]RAH98743.1 bifunctional diaminohydroxyphosphoribosylaminopyrimidine deaminase/5-amino-6-(5-phosphoribosylamino)uracil reductase RibD [Acuticoccus sediminis]